MTEMGKKPWPEDGLYRAILGAGIVFAGLLAAMLFGGGRPGTVLVFLPWLIPVISFFQSLVFFSIAFLALGRYDVLRDPSSFWIGMGAKGYGVALAFYGLTWPGLTPDGGSIIENLPGTPAWFAQIGITIFSTFLLAAVLVQHPRNRAFTGLRLVLLGACWMGFLISVFIALIRAEEHIPALVTSSGEFTGLLLIWDIIAAILFSVGFLLSTRRYRQTGDALLGYIAFAQAGYAFAILAALSGMQVYDLWWYLMRAIVTGCALIVLFSFLLEYVQLYQRERKKTEQALKAEEKLQQAACEREKLIEDLQTAVKELEDFTYSISHDLRAPIRHIGGYAHMLKKESWAVLNERARRYLDIVLNSARQMGVLIDVLLEYSRLGRTELKKSVVDLNSMIAEILQDFSEKTEGRDIQWRIDPLPRVLGDGSMLKVVFHNLISNALKFTSSIPTAVIEIGYFAKPGEHVFSVKDNGVGFDMQYAEKLFRVFEKLQAENEYEGTGIGLACVQRIINRLGGRVWAEGKVGKGATFYFSLPAAQ